MDYATAADTLSPLSLQYVARPGEPTFPSRGSQRGCGPVIDTGESHNGSIIDRLLCPGEELVSNKMAGAGQMSLS